MIQNANLALRFVLELCALAAVSHWGFSLSAGWLLRIVCGVGLPLALAVAWAVFRVPGDGGEPLVATPPQLRLLVECAVFGLGVWLLYVGGHRTLAVAFLVALLLHYGIDYRRTIDFALGRGTLA